LIKLLHPKYASCLQKDQRVEIKNNVQCIIDLLGSPEIVVDERHSTKLWSRFLAGLLATPMAKVELSPGALKSGGALPRRGPKRTARSSGATSSTHSVASPSSHRGTSPAASTSSQFTDALSPEVMTSPTAFSPPPTTLPVVSEEGQYFHHQNGQTSNTGGFIFTPNAHQAVQPAGAYDSNSMNVDGGLQNALQMDPSFFQSQPLFDNDLFQTMQAMEDPSVWQNMTMPGFNWMGGGLQSLDTDMMMDTMNSGILNVDHNQPPGNSY